MATDAGTVGQTDKQADMQTDRQTYSGTVGQRFDGQVLSVGCAFSVFCVAFVLNCRHTPRFNCLNVNAFMSVCV